MNIHHKLEINIGLILFMYKILEILKKKNKKRNDCGGGS